MGLALNTVNYYDNSAGLDLKSSPTKVAEDAASLSLNQDYSTDGAFKTRFGSSIQNKIAGIPQQMSGAPTTLKMFDFKKSDGTDIKIIATSDGKIKTSASDLSNPVDAITGLSINVKPDIEYVVTGDDEYIIFGNGSDENIKFDGTTWTNLSLPRADVVTLDSQPAGTLPDDDYEYYLSFARTVLGVIIQEGELSPVATITISGGPKDNVLNIPICMETLATGVSDQCNARVLYRKNNNTGKIVRITSEATISDNSTTTYTDNTLDDDLSSIEADFDNQAAPKSAIFELDDYGQVWFQDSEKLTDTKTSKAYKPWAVPTENLSIFDGGITCIKRCFGTLIISTSHSLWVQNGSFTDAAPRKFSSLTGILNNDCAAGKSLLYFVSTDLKLYSISPTDFSQNEMRLSDYLSVLVDPLFQDITASANDNVCLEYYTKASVAKVVISIPLAASTNSSLLIYNESQSILKGKPCWQYWNNINASCLSQMIINNEIGLYSGDYNGFLWLLDDSSVYGDGAEQNGIVTSATATTLTDTTQSWTVNSLVGYSVRITGGDAENSHGIVVSNTSDTVVIDLSFGTTPSIGDTFTIGGYDSYHFTNWKSLSGSYDDLKQIWYFLSNANASGDYPIKLILQFDFDTTVANQVELDFTLLSTNSIWGSFEWGSGIWGAQSVFENRIRYFKRFRSVRIGFYNRNAGQPFQINGIGFSFQNKKLFFGSAQ